MDLRQLRYFVTVARHGSFAAAGRAIHVSQPALGEKIRQLETELCASLFERHSRGVRLSAAGIRLMEHAERILAAIEDARRDVSAATEQNIRLTIGLNPTASRVLASDLLDAFGGSAQVLVREGMSNEIQADVGSGRLDAGFCYDPPAGSYSVVEVLKEPLHLVGRPNIVTSTTDIPFDELEGYSLVLDSGFNVLRSSLEEMARKRRVALSIAYEAEPASVKRRLLMRHDHCAVVPYALFAEEIECGSLNARRIIKPRLLRRLCLIINSALTPTTSKIITSNIQSLMKTREQEKPSRAMS